MYKRMIIASGGDNSVSSRHSPTHFPEGNLVHTMIYSIGASRGHYIYWGGGGDRFMRNHSLNTIDSRYPYNAGTEHVGFSPTRQISCSQSAKRCEVFGESQDGWVATY